MTLNRRNNTSPLKNIATQDLKNRNLQQNNNPPTTEKEILKLFSIRISQSDYNKATQIFKNKGINTSTGIRMILKDYIQKNQ